MTGAGDMLLLVVLLLDVYIIATSRINASVRAAALQGVALALLPIAVAFSSPNAQLVHVGLMSLGTLVLKAIIIPGLLLRAIREVNVRREVEPFVSLHLSLLIAAALIGISFWLATMLVLPRPAVSRLLVPIAFATILTGFLALVSRRKAITQVVGYLMLENGVFIFGQAVARELPFVVELGIFLDLLVGVFVFGIAIHQISREFDHIDTNALSTLRD